MYDRNNVASMICALVPLETTGKTCLKSPPKTMTLPPNGSNLPVISCNDLSRVSTDYLCVMATSSHMMSDASCNRVAVPLCFVKLQKEFSSSLIGILNLE